MTRFVTLSYPLAENMPLYPGTPLFKKEKIRSIKNQDACNAFIFSFSNHAGTHIDSPWHFWESGSKICNYKREDFVFKKPYIVDCPKDIDMGIEVQDLESFNNLYEYDFIILKTGFQKYRESNQYVYTNRNPYILPETAKWIRDKLPGLKAIGIDCISISCPLHKELGREAHKILLQEGGLTNKAILIVEDLYIPEKIKKLDKVIISPLIIDEVDSSPCVVTGAVND